jgi:hypothetical protein
VLALRSLGALSLKWLAGRLEQTLAREMLCSSSGHGGHNQSRWGEKPLNTSRNTLTIAALVVGSFVRVANASQIIVFEKPLDASKQQISGEFGVNRELGRAWIDVQIQETSYLGEGVPQSEVIMRMLDGLYYDSARKQVLYRTAAETIVCAEDGTFLWTTYLKSTGNCRLTASTEQRKIDDGFNVHEQTVAKVVFDAQAPSALQQSAASGG